VWRVVNPDGYGEFGYDAAGNRTSLRNPRGYVTSQSFDSLNRLKEVVQPGDVRTTYTYNNLDRVKSVTDDNGHMTTYRHDDMGRVYEEVSPDAGVTRYGYDGAGNLVSKTDARGITVLYTYDGLNRMTRIDYPNDADVILTYDTPCAYGRGRLCQATDQGGTTTYTYDPKGQLTQESKQVQGVGYLTGYGYDPNGNRTSVVYPGGRLVNYPHDSTDRVSWVTTTTAARAESVARGVLYKPFGGVKAFTYGNGLDRTVGYDLQYRITGLQTAGVQSLTLVPDPNGNVGSIVDGLAAGNSKTFGYDALDRLETAGGPWGALGWGYDGVGNRLTQTAPEGGSAYTYQPGTNRLGSVSGPEAHTFGYDAGGRINADNSRTYDYNERGRMDQAAQGGVLGQYAYDWQERRASKATGAGGRVFHYSPEGLLLSETSAAGQVLIEYVWLGSEPIAQIEGSVRRYIHADHLGTPARMTDASGAIVWSLEARPFGDGSAPTGSASLDLRFPGQYFDGETGLHQNWHRDYAPGLGRYVEVDPMRYDPAEGRLLTEDPSGFADGPNLYGYVANNPVLARDPTGTHQVVGPDGTRFWHTWCEVAHIHPSGSAFLLPCVPNLPKMPSLKCIVVCAVFTQWDNAATWALARAAAYKAALKTVTTFITKKVVPVLCLLDIPVFIACVVACDS